MVFLGKGLQTHGLQACHQREMVLLVALPAGFQALFADHAPTLGEAVMRAKRSLPDGGRGYEDLIETYTLLGDPALHLTQP